MTAVPGQPVAPPGSQAPAVRGTSRAKRAIDIAVAVVAIVLMAPLLLIIALLIRLTSRGPCLFRQVRLGLHGRPFMLLKFRTMVVNDDDSTLREAVRLELAGERAEEQGSYKLHADPRITGVGRWLRRTSIDEVPQLFNVLRGEMSLVGPRPALPWEAGMFPPEYRRRMDVPPGITGLWQVRGRSHLSTADMLRLDLEYVDTCSVALDLRILLQTIPVVLRGDGAR